MEKKIIIDPLSYKELYLRYRDNIYRFCLVYLRDKKMAEEAIYNSFIQ